LRDGELLEELTGLRTEEELLDRIRQALT
jgi:hypothetical protein